MSCFSLQQPAAPRKQEPVRHYAQVLSAEQYSARRRHFRNVSTLLRQIARNRSYALPPQGCNARVRVQRPIEGRAFMVEKVEKHEGLQDLAEVGRAHQTCQRAVRLSPGAPNDSPRQSRRFSRVKSPCCIHAILLLKE